MNFSLNLMRSKPGQLCTLIALLAALSFAALSASNANAGSSGGIATDTGTAEKTSSAVKGKRGERKYKRIWSRTSKKQKRWAARTAACESGRDPRAIGGGGRYRGAFQFMRATWRSSPRSPGGDPITYTYKTQAVVAVALRKRDGDGHWPVCG